jgi:hypothetical protein
MTDEFEAKVRRALLDAAPIAVKTLFEGATDQSLSRTKRIGFMKALMKRPDLTRQFLTAPELHTFARSIASLASDTSASATQQSQAKKLLGTISNHNVWGL